MKVVKKKTEDGITTLAVTVSTAEVSAALHQASIQFCQRMGIRPVQDKTPAQMASEQMGIKDLDSVVASEAIELFPAKAVEKAGIAPAFMPDAEPKSPLKRGRTFQFDLHVVLKPTYEIADYSPVSITVDPFVEDLTAADAEINRLAQQYTEYVATDAHPIHKGDHCFLAIKAVQDGEEMKGLSTEGRTYSMGEGYMPEGFDEGIDGMVVGETRSFTFEGPGLDENYNEIMETVECTVTLLEVQKPAAPVINDDWVQRNMPMFKSLEEMRSAINEQANKQRRMQYDDYVRGKAAEEFAKRFDGKIPDSVYEGTMRQIISTLRRDVAAQGMTWEEFQEQQGGEQQLTMMLMMQTRQQLIQGFSLDALYRKKALTTTDDDIMAVCRQMDPRQPGRIRKQMEETGYGYALRESACRLAACRYLVEHADITLRETPVEMAPPARA